MRDLATTLGIGLVSGVLSGAFGIGGGIITTPAIRLILGAPALIAVGTPLPVIFPSALTGALSYHRSGIVDVRAGIVCGLAGSAMAVLGAWTTRLVGGNVVLLATAVLILYTAADMILQIVRPPRAAAEDAPDPNAPQPSEGSGASEACEDAEEGSPVNGSADFGAPRSERPTTVSVGAPRNPPPMTRLVLIGTLTGFYSGFLGLGGGFVLVPLLTRWLGFDIKRAIATSLLAITILAVPGTVTHALLGNVDWRIAGVLALGVIPGAMLGARLTQSSADRTVRLGFAAMLLIVGAWLAASTLGGGA